MDEVKDNQKKTCWSYSRTTCFGHCKYEFYLDYIINDDNLYLSEGNFYAEVDYRRVMFLTNMYP